MIGKVMAVANMKGGVGKTSMVVALSETLASLGNKVLVIDLDAQASASICLVGDAVLEELIVKGRTIDAFVDDVLYKKKTSTFESHYIKRQVSSVTFASKQLDMSLLPSSSRLRTVERDLFFKLTKSGMSLEEIVNNLYEIVKKQLEGTRGGYDYIIFDCAPGISALTEVSIRLADIVIVPTIPDRLSTFGLQTFCATLWEAPMAKASRLKKPQQPHVLITRRRPISEHNKIVKALRNEKTEKAPRFALFDTEIYERAAISAALGMNDSYPTFTRKWTDEVIETMNTLILEIQKVLNVK
jgi:chromosome partitioning protein